MWRAYLVATYLDQQCLARPLESFRLRDPTVTIQFDASLSGVGVILKLADAPDWSFGFSSILPFDVIQNSSYQNAAEFIAVTLGMYLAVFLYGPNLRVLIVGDSQTALSWAKRLAFKGVACRCAASVFTILSLLCDVEVVSFQHMPGTDNVICDELSRNPDMIAVLEKFHIPPIPNLPTHQITNLLQLCSPLAKLDSDEQFAQLWSESRSLILDLLSLHRLHLD